EVYLPARAAAEVVMRVPVREERGFWRGKLVAEGGGHVRPGVNAGEAMGFEPGPMVVVAERVPAESRRIPFAMAFISLVALGVAALGITNTMVTNVLERVREIGVMKAVGARDRQILGMFLSEGALLGLLGGLLGLLGAYLVSLPGDGLARRL